MFFLTEEKQETRVEVDHVSCGLLQSAPLSLSDPLTAPGTTPMAQGDHIASIYSCKVNLFAKLDKIFCTENTKDQLAIVNLSPEMTYYLHF